MKRFAMTLEDGQQEIRGQLVQLAEKIVVVGEMVERVWQVVQRLQTNEETNRALVDRLIEMSMVQKGEVDAANIHRRTATPRVESHPQEEDWNPSPLDEEWPPDGCDSADLKG
jgi:hypothetical protein